MLRILSVLGFILFFVHVTAQSSITHSKIDRKTVVDRHRIVTAATNLKSPAQVGNGEFAFGVDITGLQTFVPFNTLAHWSWHSFRLPDSLCVNDFEGTLLDTHGRLVKYAIPNGEQSNLSSWLAANPHCFNLGRLGLVLKKLDGSIATLSDLRDTRQEVDLWSGIIYSSFTLEGTPVTVKTACHPSSDAIGVSVKSDLIAKGRIKLFLDFPYPDTKQFADYVGTYDRPDAHSSIHVSKGARAALIARTLDDTRYFVSLSWSSPARLVRGDTLSSPHRFYLDPNQTNELSFTALFSPEERGQSVMTAAALFDASSTSWQSFWESGAAIDLSKSTDGRWKELERRVVLSQYLMKVNAAGSYPPQEAGLVNNGWYGRYHFEMIWWHGVHYALWNRWPLFDKGLHLFADFLPSSKQRAVEQGFTGARWPKCTGNFDRDWPHAIHALLIWQQPHPIYFAELDYRLHPGKKTLDKWRDIVFSTADFMSDFAYYDEPNHRYILGPPIHIVSENTKPEGTFNPAFELGYWRFGLRTAQLWRERSGMDRDPKWDDVLTHLAPLPQEDGRYITHEKLDSMWTKFSFEHPALIGTLGMLPGDGVDRIPFDRTLTKILSTWNFDRTWGWDFPMLAMAAARSGKPDLAVDFLMHKSAGFQFDEHGLATGGPFPYFPSNGALLTAVAMMAGGWEGSEGKAPGFPKNGDWVVQCEGFNKMP